MDVFAPGQERQSWHRALGPRKLPGKNKPPYLVDMAVSAGLQTRCRFLVGAEGLEPPTSCV